LLEITDDIHWVRDWRRYSGASAAGAVGVDGAAEAARGAAAGGLKRGEGLEAGGSPVHSKSLTATYFPGALRNPENRARTVSPEAAAAAVRAGLRRGENQ